MQAWWESLGTAVQILYCVAIPSSLIMLIQAILLMFGIGHGGEGVDFSDTSGIDFDGTGGDIPDLGGPHQVDASIANDGSNPADLGTMQLFTLQGIMTFLCVFGWTGIIAIHGGLHIAIALILAFVLGFLAMLGVAKLFQLTRRLTQNGSIVMKNLLGQKATVYIPIPEKGKGQGKVTVALSERFLEFNAITDGEKSLSTNSSVRVIDVRGDVLVVEVED